MLKKILLVVLVLIIAFLGIASTKPDEFVVTRSATINAPASVVFGNVNDLKKWEAWSPWVEMDPESVATYAGPAAGKGASTHWAGKKSGEGTMTITESNASAIKFQLDFIKPMKATNTADFTFKTEGNSTVVTWGMYGHNNFLSKMMSVVMNCEKMVGDQFDKGLANLKAISEKR
jgi:hypothetical protein